MARPRRGLEMGILMLLWQFAEVGFQNVPPVTILAIAGQVGLYMGVIPVSWDAASVCLSAQAVLKWREYERLVLSALEHGDDIHLYYNMVSFLFKGRTLENHFGSLYFGYLLTVFTVLCSGVYVGLEVLLSELMQDRNYYKQCAIGFSGVIFALKVLTTHYWETGHRRYFGVRISSKYAVWAELILIQLMVPNASFIGHLSGIIVGVLYTQGPLKLIMDLPMNAVTLVAPASSVYTEWGSGVSGTSQTPRPYGWSVPDEDYDEAVRRSYETLQDEYPSGPAAANAEEIRRRRLERFANH